MLVPPAVENPFRDHFRALILGSALRTAEAEIDRLHASGHPRRARRTERVAGTLRGLTESPGSYPLPATAGGRRVGRPLRLLVRGAWVVAAAALLVGVAGFGVRSWTTGAADLALIALTALWFAASGGAPAPPPEPRPQQLELFE